MWEYTDYNAYPNIILHDCFVIGLRVENDRLIMDFDEAGFWLNADHPANPYADLRRTGKAQLCFEKCEIKAVQVTLEKRIRLFGRNLTSFRKEISLKKFREMIASNIWSFEFTEEYYGSFSAMFGGYIHIRDKVDSKYCQIKIEYQDMVYNWDEIQQEAIW